MKNYSIYTLFLFICFSCTSENEQAGIDKISEMFGGTVAYSKGKSVNSTDGKQSHMTLKLSNSESLNQFEPEIITSASARMFYDALSENEKSNYDIIKVAVTQNVDGAEKTTEIGYKPSDLEIAIAQQHIFEIAGEPFRDNNIDIFVQLCAPIILDSFNSDDIYNSMIEFDDEFGRYKSAMLIGHKLFSTDYQGDSLHLVHMYGVQERERQNLKFNVVVSQDTSDKYIYGFDFQ